MAWLIHFWPILIDFSLLSLVLALIFVFRVAYSNDKFFFNFQFEWLSVPAGIFKGADYRSVCISIPHMLRSFIRVPIKKSIYFKNEEMCRTNFHIKINQNIEEDFMTKKVLICVRVFIQFFCFLQRIMHKRKLTESNPLPCHLYWIFIVILKYF